MKKVVLFTMLATAFVVFSAMLAQAGNKVQICHIPPDDPANFHTITVSENALSAHLGHGDLAGACDAVCAALCDDGDACTVDDTGDCQLQGCPITPEMVDCDDSNLCTSDSCDPASGCQSAPIVCDDGDACTVDACNPSDGQCTGTPIDCGALGVCLPATGLCDFPCDGFGCDPIDQCHAAGECVLAGGLPECIDGASLTDGTACNDGSAGTINDQCTGGVCAGTPSVPSNCAAGSFNGHDYLICQGQNNIPQSEAFCAGQGMQVSFINDSAENTWLVDTALAAFGYVSFEETSYWVANTKSNPGIEPIPWANSEPNNPGDECIHILRYVGQPYKWNDASCTFWTWGWVCESGG